jgi:hypothetical protein
MLIGGLRGVPLGPQPRYSVVLLPILQVLQTDNMCKIIVVLRKSNHVFVIGFWHNSAYNILYKKEDKIA